MENKNGFIKLKNGGIQSDYYLFPDSIKKDFGIIGIWPELLHPGITSKKLKDEERYNLSIISLNRGQTKFEVYANSREEIHEIFLYFLRRGYRHIKIVKDTSRKGSTCSKKIYSLENLYNSKNVYMFNTIGSRNILNITINLKNLDKFKEDLFNFSGYRTIWLNNSICNNIRNNFKIVE